MNIIDVEELRRITLEARVAHESDRVKKIIARIPELTQTAARHAHNYTYVMELKSGKDYNSSHETRKGILEAGLLKDDGLAVFRYCRDIGLQPSIHECPCSWTGIGHEFHIKVNW